MENSTNIMCENVDVQKVTINKSQIKGMRVTVPNKGYKQSNQRSDMIIIIGFLSLIFYFVRLLKSILW